MGKYATIVFKRHDEAYQARINIIDLTTGLDVLRDKIVDTYIKYCDYTNGVFEYLNFTYPLKYTDHQYQIQVFNYGAVSGRTYGSGSPIGSVEVDSMRITTDLEGAKPLATLLLLWQNERPHLYQFSNINLETKTEITKEQSFLADGTTKVFTLNDENTASDFHSFSDDGGLTWKTPYDLSVVWGSNAPDYDNQTINAEGHFSLKFFSAPIANSVIIIRYFPMANRARLYTIFDLAHDSSFVDFKTPSRLTNMSIELFK